LSNGSFRRLASRWSSWFATLAANSHGHLDQQSAMCCVNFGAIPAGLDATHLKRYLLENGHEVVPQSRRRS
jgi:hypothetical protein